MSRNKPRLQIALDLLDLEKAIKICQEAIKNGVDIIEAGTPLIEKFGIQVTLPKLRNIARKLPITADLKIADAGYLSSKIAFEFGADIVTVLAAASDKTIEGVMNASREYSGAVMADLIVSRDIEADIEKALSLGVDYILVHTGLDEQAKGLTALDRLKNITKLIPGEKLAVAGGLNENNIDNILRFKPSIIIVGGAITKSLDPGTTVRKIKNIILSHS